MLVDYSDSESEVGDEQPSKRRKVKEARVKGPPPLPAAFHSLYVANIRAATADDPSLHGGRSRQVPHLEGNWPSHVYLECMMKSNDVRVLADLSRAS